MKKSQLASAISFALLSAGATGWVQAQEEETGAHRGLEQVIVQARRVEENVQDVPLAITALSSEELEKRGVAKVSDLVQRAPAIEYHDATGRKDAAIFGIRGQKADDILLTSDQAVAVLIGGVPMNWAYGVAQSGALDISAVEVAKGPQGTLFGKNSTGGAIIITPAEPDQAFSAKVKAGIGNYNLRTLEGMVNSGLTDTLAGRIAVSATKHDGYEKNLDGGEDFNSADQWAARASLKWQPTDALTHLLVVEGSYSSSSGQLSKPLAAKSTSLVGALYTPAYNAAIANDGFFAGHSDAPHGGGYNDLKSWGVLNTTTFDASDSITIKNIVGVRDMWYEGTGDLDGVNSASIDSTTPAFQAFLTAALPAAQVGPTTFALNHAQFTSTQFTSAQSVTEELQVIGTSDVADWIGGLYYAHTDGRDGAIGAQFNGLGNRQMSGPAGGVINQTIAAFAQSTWHLTDRLNLTTGARITKDDRSVTYKSQKVASTFQPFSCLLVTTVTNATGTSTTSGAPLGCVETFNKSFHEPTWNLSLDYKLTDSQLIYAATRHGYRSGGFPGRGTTPDTTSPFDPEKVNDVEVGHKFDGDLAGIPLRVNTAIFYQAYHNIQRNVTFTDTATNSLQNTVRNAAAGTLYGGEIEFTVLPIDSLELSGFVSYVDASYDKWDDKNSSAFCQVAANASSQTCTTLVDRSVNTFPMVPKTSASLSARYTLPLPANVGEVAIGASVYWQDQMSLYVDNARDGTNAECKGSDADGYKLYNANVDWNGVLGMDGLSLSAWGKNLGNEKYFTSGLCIYNTAGISTGYIGDPRTYGVTAQYKF